MPVDQLYPARCRHLARGDLAMFARVKVQSVEPGKLGEMELCTLCSASLMVFIVKLASGPDAVQQRPANYDDLTPESQWAIDKRLGILDWDGTDGT